MGNKPVTETLPSHVHHAVNKLLHVIDGHLVAKMDLSEHKHHNLAFSDVKGSEPSGNNAKTISNIIAPSKDGNSVA